MPWFAVRTVFDWGPKANGRNVFEERIVAFEADDAAGAFAKAEAESRDYADGQDFARHPEFEAYQLDDEALIDGHEVYSQLFEARLTLAEFYEQRYEHYRYTPPA
jgi:hypothetical protein